MKKTIAIFLFVTIIACLFSSCSDKNTSPVGTYLYEAEGFGGDFYIKIYEDGTFTYSVGMLSSYLGRGNWTLDGDVLCLKDHEYPSLKYVNYFKVKEDKLIFIESGSTNFMYLNVADGASFNKEASK